MSYCIALNGTEFANIHTAFKTKMAILCCSDESRFKPSVYKSIQMQHL